MRRSLQIVLDAIDQALLDAGDQIDVDKLVAARQCLIETRYVVVKGRRRVFVKYCPKCDTPKPVFLFNRNASKKDGLQTICRGCQRDTYQEHCGSMAEPDHREVG